MGELKVTMTRKIHGVCWQSYMVITSKKIRDPILYFCNEWTGMVPYPIILGIEKSTLIHRILSLSAGNLIQNRSSKQGPWNESHNCFESNNRCCPDAFSSNCPIMRGPPSKIYIFLKKPQFMTLWFHNVSLLQRFMLTLSFIT